MQSQDAVNSQLQSAAQGTGAAIGTFLAYALMITLACAIVFSIICAFMAARRDRSIGAGVVGGFIFGLFAVIYYLIAGDSVELRVEREEAARKRIHEREND